MEMLAAPGSCARRSRDMPGWGSRLSLWACRRRPRHPPGRPRVAGPLRSRTEHPHLTSSCSCRAPHRRASPRARHQPGSAEIHDLGPMDPADSGKPETPAVAPPPVALVHSLPVPNRQYHADADVAIDPSSRPRIQPPLSARSSTRLSAPFHPRCGPALRARSPAVAVLSLSAGLPRRSPIPCASCATDCFAPATGYAQRKSAERKCLPSIPHTRWSLLEQPLALPSHPFQQRPLDG